MNIDDAFPSNFVKACDLNGAPRIMRISGVATESMGNGETKPVLYFSNATKGLVLNKTNASVLRDLYGPDTDNWAGKAIQLTPATTDFQGRVVDCIRLRAVMPKTRPQPQVVTEAPKHVTEPAGEPESFDDLDDEIPF